MKHELPKLEYKYDALEPFIDEKTMEIHYSKHHQAYADKFNAAIEGNKKLEKISAEEIIKNIEKIDENIRNAVRNNGGGFVNHSFFWKILKKDVKIHKEIKKAIEERFESFEKFKEEFTNSAMGLFGSGWTWLVLDNGELKIINTSNQDSPLSKNMIPLIAIDLWEHAYYLKYQNRRKEYIDSFFNVINWKRVNEIYLKSGVENGNDK
mgnify:CR=1 FL=1